MDGIQSKKLQRANELINVYGSQVRPSAVNN
jgi:hypothetical protein